MASTAETAIRTWKKNRVIQVQNDFWRCVQRCEFDSVRAMLDESYICIDLESRVSDRTFFTDPITAPIIRHFEIVALNIAIEENVSVVVMSAKGTVEFGSKNFAGLMRISQTWTEKFKTWRCLSLHISDANRFLRA